MAHSESKRETDALTLPMSKSTPKRCGNLHMNVPFVWCKNLKLKKGYVTSLKGKNYNMANRN